jgi:hypothetical protein
MKKIPIILIAIIVGCIAHEPPFFQKCAPENTTLSINQGETIAFSCTASDPDTKNLTYAWYMNEEKVSDTHWYDFDKTAGEYTVLLEVSDGTTTISRTWGVTVIFSLDLERVQERVEHIRGLKFLEPVKRLEIDRDQMRENLIADLKENRLDFLTEQDIYAAFHVWDPKMDLYEIYVDILTIQVASYYDTEDHIFYEVIEPDAPNTYREFIASHELVHALQDQHHYLKEEFENDDQYLAFLCVVEGDAMFHQYMYLNEMTYSEKTSLFTYLNNLTISVINPFLENLLLLKYNLGYEFIAEMSCFGLESLYEQLPVSTEQIMHPEKYVSQELPVAVDIPSIAGWEEKAQDVLGEALILSILKEHISTQKAAEAAEGWGGDRYAYYEQDRTYLIILNTVWDTERDATEFFDAYYDFTVSWSNSDIPEISENIYETPTGFLVLVQKGKQVIVIESPSFDAVNAALFALALSAS